MNSTIAILAFLAAASAAPQNSKPSALSGVTATAITAQGEEEARRDHWDAALRHYNEAIRIDPTFARAYRSRALAWQVKGDAAKAIADVTEAVRLAPKDSQALGIRSGMLAHRGEVEKALTDAEEAIRLDPTYSLPYQVRATLRVHGGKLDEALKDANVAVRLNPDSAQVYTTRAAVHLVSGDLPKTLEDMNRAVLLSPKDASLLVSRATCWRSAKAWNEVLKDLDTAVRLDPKNASAWSDRAWLRATCADHKYRDGKMAIDDATRACRLSSWKNGNHLTALAAAHAEAGEFPEAIKFAMKALEFPGSGEDWTDRAKKRLKLYEEKQPYRAKE